MPMDWQDYYWDGTDRYISYYSDLLERCNDLLQSDMRQQRVQVKDRKRQADEENLLEQDALDTLEEERTNVLEAFNVARIKGDLINVFSIAQSLVIFLDRRGYWE